MEHTIDAKERSLGRVASEAATLLMGKHIPGQAKNIIADVTVRVINAEKLRITEKKKGDTTFWRASGYPGTKKTFTMAKVIEDKGHAELVRHAIRGMLPSNKLRVLRLKRLSITN